MDYEKEYKEALARARDVYTYYCDDREQLRKIEFIFPVLKESEDERIRKALIEYFNEQCDMSDWNGIYGYQVVAWLEKQGQVKDSANFQHENKMCKENGDSLTNEDEAVRKELIDAVNSLWNNDALPMPLTTKKRNKWLAWLEKQGKTSPILSNSSSIVKNWDEENERRVNLSVFRANKN